MKKQLVLLLHFCFAALHGASIATVTISPTIASINELDVDDLPGPLYISSALAGMDPMPASGTAYYSISTNNPSVRIQGNLNGPLPLGVCLRLFMQAPQSGASAGLVPLMSSPAPLVTGIGPGYKQYVPIFIQMDASLLADPRSDICIVQYTSLVP